MQSDLLDDFHQLDDDDDQIPHKSSSRQSTEIQEVLSTWSSFSDLSPVAASPEAQRVLSRLSFSSVEQTSYKPSDINHESAPRNSSLVESTTYPKENQQTHSHHSPTRSLESISSIINKPQTKNESRVSRNSSSNSWSVLSRNSSARRGNSKISHHSVIPSEEKIPTPSLDIQPDISYYSPQTTRTNSPHTNTDQWGATSRLSRPTCSANSDRHTPQQRPDGIPTHQHIEEPSTTISAACNNDDSSFLNRNPENTNTVSEDSLITKPSTLHIDPNTTNNQRLVRPHDNDPEHDPLHSKQSTSPSKTVSPNSVKDIVQPLASVQECTTKLTSESYWKDQSPLETSETLQKLEMSPGRMSTPSLSSQGISNNTSTKPGTEVHQIIDDDAIQTFPTELVNSICLTPTNEKHQQPLSPTISPKVTEETNHSIIDDVHVHTHLQKIEPVHKHSTNESNAIQTLANKIPPELSLNITPEPLTEVGNLTTEHILDIKPPSLIKPLDEDPDTNTVQLSTNENSVQLSPLREPSKGVEQRINTDANQTEAIPTHLTDNEIVPDLPHTPSGSPSCSKNPADEREQNNSVESDLTSSGTSDHGKRPSSTCKTHRAEAELPPPTLSKQIDDTIAVGTVAGITMSNSMRQSPDKVESIQELPSGNTKSFDTSSRKSSASVTKHKDHVEESNSRSPSRSVRSFQMPQQSSLEPKPIDSTENMTGKEILAAHQLNVEELTESQQEVTAVEEIRRVYSRNSFEVTPNTALLYDIDPTTGEHYDIAVNSCSPSHQNIAEKSVDNSDPPAMRTHTPELHSVTLRQRHSAHKKVIPVSDTTPMDSNDMLPSVSKNVTEADKILSKEKLMSQRIPSAESSKPSQSVSYPNNRQPLYDNYTEATTMDSRLKRELSTLGAATEKFEIVNELPSKKDHPHQLFTRQVTNVLYKTSRKSTTFGENQSTHRHKLNYHSEAEYDPCREWLRLITGLVSVVVAIITVYPIHLGVDCYLDQYEDDELDLSQCKNLFNIELSIVVLGIAVAVEVVTIALFMFACRHEFCGAKRNYKTGLLCCSPTHTAVVYPISQPESGST